MKMKYKLIPFILASMVLCGCGKGTSSSSSESSRAAVNVTAKEVLSEIDNELLDGIVCMGDESFDRNTDKFYGVSPDSIEDGGILYNSEGGYADEISFVRFKGEVDGIAVLQKRLEERTATFKDYRPEELPKLENARITSVGDYDLLIISDDADSLEKQIEEKLSCRRH